MRLYFQKLEHIGASDWKTLCLSKNNIYPIFRRTSIYYIWISYDNAYPIPYDVDKKVLSHLPRNPIGGHLRDLSINTYVTLTIAFLITQTHMSSLFTLQRIFNIWLPLLRVQRNHSSWNKVSKWQISLVTPSLSIHVIICHGSHKCHLLHHCVLMECSLMCIFLVYSPIQSLYG